MSNERSIRRGFGRLGLGLAVLAGVAGVTLTGYAGYAAYAGHATFIVTVTATGDQVEYPWYVDDQVVARSMREHFGQTVAYAPPVRSSPVVAAGEAVATGLVATSALAGALWGFFLGLGWVIAGFKD